MIIVPAAIMQRIHSTISTINANRPGELDEYFASDATVVDERAPFVWSGPHAASRWLGRVDNFLLKEAGATGVRAQLERVTEYNLDREGDDAYVTVAVNVDPANSKRNPEEGLWVLTLHKAAGSWKITSAAWAPKPANAPGPSLQAGVSFVRIQ